MNKTFTQKFYNRFKIILLVVAMLGVFAMTQNVKAAPLPTNSIVQIRVIKCYPNPAVSFINFDNLSNYVSKNYTLEVYSFTGKKLYESNINTAKITLTFSNDFYRGIYIYQVHDGSGRLVETGKFQVNR